MLKKPHIRFWIAVLLIGLAVVLGSGGCKMPAPIVLTNSDSIVEATVVYHHDTIIHTLSDSARIIHLVKDVDAMRKLMEQLRSNPVIAKGLRNSSVSMRVAGDSLIVTGNCDSLELELKNAITETVTLRRELSQRNVLLPGNTNDNDNERSGLPRWVQAVKGLFGSLMWLALVITICVLAIRIIPTFISNKRNGEQPS